MEKYIPKNTCKNCGKEIWDYDENKETITCKEYNHKTGKTTGCGKEIKKKLHNLIGASISKNEKGMYELEFKEYNELSIYPDWESLQSAMERLSKND